MEMALEWAVRMSRNSETAMLAQQAQGHRMEDPEGRERCV
jgi:hypothetical protein